MSVLGLRHERNGGGAAHLDAGFGDDKVWTNPQIAAARDSVARYGSGRVLTHTIVHPNTGPGELEQMAVRREQLGPSGWKVYTLSGPPAAASPTGGWFLDDEEVGFPFFEQVSATPGSGA